MGSNFYTPYSNTAPKTNFTVASMDPPFASLDAAITKLKNVIVNGGGNITYNKTTGVLSWSATIYIHFNSTAGLMISNTIAAGNITLADNEFVYVDLVETNAYALTATKGTFTASNASTFITFNRIVLAYRTAADDIYSVYLRSALNDPNKNVQSLTCADSVTVDWSKGSVAEITLDRATTTFTFTNAYSGQRCILIIKQYAGVGAIAFTSEVRGSDDLASPPSLSSVANKKDYLEYIYNGTDATYDFQKIVKGFGTGSSASSSASPSKSPSASPSNSPSASPSASPSESPSTSPSS